MNTITKDEEFNKQLEPFICLIQGLLSEEYNEPEVNLRSISEKIIKYEIGLISTIILKCKPRGGNWFSPEVIKKERKKGPSCVYICPDCGAKVIGKNRTGTMIRAATHMIKVHNRKNNIPSNELNEHIIELKKELPDV